MHPTISETAIVTYTTMTSPSFSASNKKSQYRYLPLGYEPTEFDVVCGRGRWFFHKGNQ